MIPLHPESLPDPRALRWVVPEHVLPGVGTATAAPAALMALLEDGTLSRVVLGRCEVLTHLGSGTWAEAGPRVRTALHAALADPAGWRWDDGPDGDEDAHPAPSDGHTLAEAAQRLLDGEIGALARSHGGRIDLVRVTDGVVEVRMRGACHGCGAATQTLRGRMERALRATHPGVVEVRDAGAAPGPAMTGGPSFLGLPRLRVRR